MKWVFVSVLLINAVYFIYNTFYHVELKITSQPLLSKDKGQIVLLEELDKAELKALQDKVNLINKPTQITASITKPQDDTSTIDKTIDNSKENISREQPVQLTNLCYTLGPFTKNKMDDVRLVLEKEYNNQLSFGIETTSAITYYRIYIPPLESKDKIRETLALLDKNKLTDHYVMSIDGRKNAIALGVFKQKKAAEKIAGIAESVGLSTTIEAISNDKNSLYNLHVIFQKTHDISRYQELIKQKDLKSKVCENKG